MHSLEIIIALNDRAVKEQGDRDKKTVEKIIRDLADGHDTPAVQALRSYLSKVTSPAHAAV